MDNNLRPPFSELELASMQAAIREEIAAGKETVRSTWLDIDAIQHLSDMPGKFVYQLVLSTPLQFSAEQTVTFLTRSPKETIQASIIRSDDEGLVVECEKPLPSDARLLQMTFDPSFILNALDDFLVQLLPDAGCIARMVARKEIPAATSHQPVPEQGLNEDQCISIGEMTSSPLHLLWGPPGTGKTTTVGAAVVRWMREGKRVLIVSTSNAAVDVAMRAVLRRVRPEEKKWLFRLGASLDPEVMELTLTGKAKARNLPLAGAALLAQHRLGKITESLSNRHQSPETMETLYREAKKYEDQIAEFAKKVEASAPQLVQGVRVTACTLAKMVLDHDLRERTFDVVVLDEASMASLLYSIAASLLASRHLVYAGDPKQLPPIVQASGSNAAKWIGKNIYDWLGVEMEGEVAATKLSLLRTQYRMTNQIGGVVSRLNYNDLLRHGRGHNGPRIEFIAIPEEWQTTNYSVPQHSYYHLAAIPLMHGLAGGLIDLKELLLLSPFRPQRSLLSALAYDLRKNGNDSKITASTIHRAQGSEAKVVVVDLTTHSPANVVAFFRDKHCSKLFNVAISRARDHLIVLGSEPLLHELASTMPFWKGVLREFGDGIDSILCDEVLEELECVDSLGDVRLEAKKGFPAIYCHTADRNSLLLGTELLKRTEGTRKLLVVPDSYTQIEDGAFIIRRSTKCPSLFLGEGKICLPFAKKWVVVDSPNASRVIWRIAFSHIAEDEVDPIQVKRFFCPECTTGDLVLQNCRGEGWFLGCTNGQIHQCYYRRRLSLEDAKLKVRIQGMICPDKHPLTVRTGPKGFFLGCENYPDCDYRESLAILQGV